MSTSSNIVVGIDASDYARNALGWAVELAGAVPGAVLHLVHSYYVSLPVQGFQEQRVLQVGAAR